MEEIAVDGIRRGSAVDRQRGKRRLAGRARLRLTGILAMTERASQKDTKLRQKVLYDGQVCVM